MCVVVVCSGAVRCALSVHTRCRGGRRCCGSARCGMPCPESPPRTTCSCVTCLVNHLYHLISLVNCLSSSHMFSQHPGNDLVFLVNYCTCSGALSLAAQKTMKTPTKTIYRNTTNTVHKHNTDYINSPCCVYEQCLLCFYR